MAYITVDDLRNEGVTDPPYSKEHLETRITLACRHVDMLTGCFYEPTAAHVVILDGTGHDLLFLPYPPTSTSAITTIEVASHSLDGTTWTDVGSGGWEVVMPLHPDGRFNPKIVNLLGNWREGKRNYRLTGEFGFVEADKSVPPGIKELALRIAIWDMPEFADVAGQKADRIIEEELRDYSYKLADPLALSKGYFNDPRIDNLVSMFHRPGVKVV